MPWYNPMLINWYKFTTYKRTHPKLFWGVSLSLVGVVYLKAWIPLTKISIPCPFHEWTGLYCPGCGVTRVILSLLKFDVIQAFRFNPLLFILAPLYMLYWITNKKQIRPLSQAIMTIMLILTVTFGILRNLPLFEYLAPTVIR
ncbi:MULTISPECIES: DUF2752 domain-containing protein [Paenibacillus]|uniref:DUF2752 domain-containing protein n=2 Tax=Paenibacillus TaxID=44249 RepID=UPI00273F5408|nr:DUF2752 domain-containing protein [Paenibacillus odorifer]